MCFMRNLVGKSDSMAKYSLLKVDGGRREEKRMVNHRLVISQFLKSQDFFIRCVCVCLCAKSFLYLRIGFLCEEISL